MVMAGNDVDLLTFWRNLITQWHLDAGLPGCGCDDETEDADYCVESVLWADDRLSNRDDPALAGPADRWDHDTWKAAWGFNAPMIAGDLDFRLPVPPAGTSWLVTRILVRGQTAVDLALYRLNEHRLVSLATARVVAEPTTIQTRAKAMLRGLERC